VLAQQAGATNVINPVRFTGQSLAGTAHGQHTAGYLSDLASISGRVHLVERPVRDEEVGQPSTRSASGGQGLRIYRGGKAYGFWEAESKQSARGDMIVEIVPTAPTDGAVGASMA
ncbi:hypothetical protein OY671_009802, partial [Metschnikowia pulcherrima]